MKQKNHLVLVAAGCAIAACLATPTVRASEWDKKTTVTFNTPVEVPGAVLQPGKYVMRLVDLPASRHLVQFMNDRENHVFTTAMAIPASRTEASDQTKITFYEMPAGQPEAMKAWFYPGDTWGQEFAYPKDRARLLSSATHETVPSTDLVSRGATEPQAAVAADNSGSTAAATGSLNTAPDSNTPGNLTATAAEPAEGQAAVAGSVAANAADPSASEDSDRPQLIAQNNAPEPPAPADPNQPALPKTATETAAFALIGLSAIAGGFALRKYRKQSS